MSETDIAKAWREAMAHPRELSPEQKAMASAHAKFLRGLALTDEERAALRAHAFALVAPLARHMAEQQRAASVAVAQSLAPALTEARRAAAREGLTMFQAVARQAAEAVRAA